MIDMLMDNAKTFKLNENSYLGLASLISTDYKISGKLTPNTGLSNGDSVRLEWNVNVEKLEKQYHVKMGYEDQVFTVNGLDDAEAYDPFEDISTAAK